MERIIKGIMVVTLSLFLGFSFSADAIAQCCGCEGCTPGFWKQEQHLDRWCGNYTSDLLFIDVFGVDPDVTLIEALWAHGGGENALMRHAVAALLNACSPDVNFRYSTSEVIAMVQEAYATGDFETFKDLLATANELGCPLD